MTNPLSELLEQAVARSGATEQVRGARVIEEATRAIQDMFGDDISAFFRPRSYRHGALQCEANSTAAADAVKTRQGELFGLLQKKFPQLQFERLIVRIN